MGGKRPYTWEMTKAWTDSEWGTVLTRLKDDAVVQADELEFTAKDVERLLGAAPEVDGRRCIAKATFVGARFGAGVSFGGVAFGDADFSAATFGDMASFASATFGGQTIFRRATFGDCVDFSDTSFGEGAAFHGVLFRGGASLQRAAFGNDAVLGPLVVAGTLAADDITIERPRHVSIAARLIVSRRLRIPGGGILFVRWADLILDDADFSDPVVLKLGDCAALNDEMALIVTSEDARPSSGTPSPVDAPRAGDPRPSILSLRGANLEQLLLSDVRLDACDVTGAHHLAGLLLEGETSFARAPESMQRLRPDSGRRTLAQEYKWRVLKGHIGWRASRIPVGRFSQDGDVVDAGPATLAGQYRALRKGREEAKDEPAALDFYYGEMEMRRHAAPWGWVRLVLTGYWVLSGYGLRALRSLIAFVALLLLGAGLLNWWGFKADHDFAYAITASAESTTSLFRPTSQPYDFTGSGDAAQIVLRTLGPALLALAALALRAHVKRS